MKKYTQAIQHGSEKVPEEKNNGNKIVRIEGAQCVLTGTNSVLLYGGTQVAICRMYARFQVGNRGDNRDGRPDQNTNVRKGSGGTVQSDMKTGRTGYEKYGPSREKGRRSTVTVARQVWVQRAAHSKRGAEETHA